MVGSWAAKAGIDEGRLPEVQFIGHRQSNPDGPDVFEFQGCFLSNNFSFVPGELGAIFVNSFHDELLQ